MHRSARRRLTRDSLNKYEATFLLAFLDVLEDSVQIVIETSGEGVADSTNFIDNWIVVHGLAYNNSSCVQMIGALNPFSLQIFSITGLITALAKCRQFHVNK